MAVTVQVQDKQVTNNSSTASGANCSLEVEPVNFGQKSAHAFNISQMKDTLKDANFPRTADGRVYHLGFKPGEIANRIITVGTPSRAQMIASHLDNPATAFRLTSERAFTTITGLYKGIPVSIVSIGMGYPNMDFFVRETRECVDGDMAIIRIGSCGGLADLSVGSLVVPQACVAVTRNVDYDFFDTSLSEEDAYKISKKVDADTELYTTLKACLDDRLNTADMDIRIITDVVNASADSFYSSQGRQTSFPDKNEKLIQRLIREIPRLATLEMETFHLYHLAYIWTSFVKANNEQDKDVVMQAVYGNDQSQELLPPVDLPVSPHIITGPPAPSKTSLEPRTLNGAERSISKVNNRRSLIRAAALHMVFAARTSQDFITPAQVAALESWSGRVALDAVCKVHIPDEQTHDVRGSVWEWM